MTRTRRLSAFCVVIAALTPCSLICSAGCGKRIAGPQPPPVYAVTGKVLYEDGTPVVNGLVKFVTESDPNLNITAAAGEDGSFKLLTLYGNHRLEGTMEGRYRVTITPPCKFTVDDPPRPVTLSEPYHVKAEPSRFEFKIPRKK